MPDLDVRLGPMTRHRGAWETLLAWRATRLPWSRFLPLALLLGWAGSAGEPLHPVAYALNAVLAFVLVAQLRLWDDIADIGADRLRHSERVLPRCGDVRAVIAACILMAGACAIALYACRGPAAAMGYGVLCLCLGAWYGLYEARDAVHAHVLLLKYPAVVLTLASPPAAGWPVAGVAVSVYAAMCAFELSDRTSSSPASSRTVLGVHAVLAGAAALGPRLEPIGIGAALLAALSILAGVGGAGVRRYLPFLAPVVLLVRFSIGGSA